MYHLHQHWKSSINAHWQLETYSLTDHDAAPLLLINKRPSCLPKSFMLSHVGLITQRLYSQVKAVPMKLWLDTRTLLNNTQEHIGVLINWLHCRPWVLACA